MWTKYLTKLTIQRIENDRGAALIFSYMILTVLFTLTAGFALSNVTELNHATRYRDTTAAFWAAEAGVNRFIQNTDLLNSTNPSVVTIGSHGVSIFKDDTDPLERIVTSTTTVNGITKTLEIRFPQQPPDVFSNTISTGGNMSLSAFFAGLDVNDKARIAGSFSSSGFASGYSFEDKVEGVAQNTVQLTYPDTDGNGTADEFNDFVEYNRNIVSLYDPSEVVYVTSDSPVLIYPNSTLVGKKIIYVEGTTPGAGDVDIIFDPTWASDQNVTVISTGSVNYLQPLQSSSANSQLNTISWDNYNEGSIFYSAHSGVTYTHSDANFGSIIALSDTDGSVITNGDFNANLAIAWKRFDWEDPLDANGAVPPGFEGLVAGGGGGYADTPTSWAEL